MLSYELAQELKSAGFPYEWCEDTHNCDPYICFPFFDDIIDELGAHFGVLTRKSRREWYADSERGTSAENAVAALWLALHQKS